jgi:serine/threonine protein kinase
MTESPQNSTSARTDTAELAARLQNVVGNRFTVLRPIAIGGMATIFVMRHRLHNGLFVAKVLHPELVEKPGIVRGFRLEATHAAVIGNHPNAVPVFDFGELDGLFFLLMPYVDGKDLDQVLRHSGPLEREEALHMAAQISSVLCHAESQGIVHCDLTPGNIRLDKFGQYRVLDFGISQAKGLQDRPFTGGTPLYSSPELIAGQAVDVRSDLYSLGAVLGEAIDGKPLFADDTLEQIERRHIEGNWRMPALLDEGDPIALLLRKLLNTDPAERPASAYELSGVLHALGSARPEFRPRTKNADPNETKPASPPRRRLSS